MPVRQDVPFMRSSCHTQNTPFVCFRRVIAVGMYPKLGGLLEQSRYGIEVDGFSGGTV